MACRLKPEMSRPSNRMMPSDGMSLSSARAKVDLPDPELANHADGLAAAQAEADAVHRPQHQHGWPEVPASELEFDRYLAAFENARRAARHRCLAALGLRRQQRRRIGIARMVEHRIGFAFLDHRARLHDIDPVGNPAHDAEIVGDEHETHAEPLLQVAKQCQDLGLDRDIERRRRLVGDQQVRIIGDCHGDHHPLPLAARQLMRIGMEPPLGIWIRTRRRSSRAFSSAARAPMR